MRLIYHKKSLPRHFRGHPKTKGLIHESDLKIGSSRLRAKLLIFRNRTCLRHFWKHGLGKSELGRWTLGVVNGLYHKVQDCSASDKISKPWLEADRRYFCVIGLSLKAINAEIIAHESVHAAYCYVQRVRRTPWDQQIERFEEESVAYPTGLIAAEINKVYWELSKKNQPPL